MSYRTLLLITLLGLAACSGGSQDPATGPATGGEETGTAPAGEEPGTTPSWRDQRTELGLETYRVACASCHDAGEDGAPVIGRREDWSGRSDMWQAVLFEHARAGYLDMPGKGGRTDLSDEAVEAAAEYMLEKTFPELPED